MLSRVADSLYWMSRYFERANHCARVLEANYNLMLNPATLSTAERWRRLMASLGIAATAGSIDPHIAMLKPTRDPRAHSFLPTVLPESRAHAAQAP